MNQKSIDGRCVCIPCDFFTSHSTCYSISSCFFMEGIDSDDRLEVGIFVEMREAEPVKMWPGPRMVPVQGNKQKLKMNAKKLVSNLTE